MSATVDIVEVRDVPVNYTVPGSVMSDGRVEVSSRVVGFIEQLDVREGQPVKRGDLLVRIDSTDIDEAIRQARSGVVAAQEDLADAEYDVERYARLTQSGTIAAETLRKANVRADIARATLDRARSALPAAEAQKDYATITSPVDGIIVSVVRRSGETPVANLWNVGAGVKRWGDAGTAACTRTANAVVRQLVEKFPVATLAEATARPR